MMQWLQAGGISVASDNIRQPDEDNPRGYFELESVKRLRTAPTSFDVEVLRGRAVKLVYRLLYCLPPGYPYRVIVMRRNLEEVIASQRIMLKRHGIPIQASDERLVSIYERELEYLRDWLSNNIHIACLWVDYNKLIFDPRSVAGTVNGFLGDRLDVARMLQVNDATLYRCRS